MRTVSRDFCPRNPGRRQARANSARRRRSGALTVTALPHRNRLSSSTSPQVLAISAPSAQIKLSGSMTMAESVFEYQARAMVDPSTAGRDALMTMAWHAVVIELRTPNMTPRLRRERKGRKKDKRKQVRAIVSGTNLRVRLTAARREEPRKRAHLLTLADPPPSMTPIRKPIVTMAQLPSESRPGSTLYAR